MLLAGVVTIPASAAESPLGVPCTDSGHITYTLQRAPSPTPEQSMAYGLITTAMDEALSWYNCFADRTKKVTVSFNPGVPTAQASAAGTLAFGKDTQYMQKITAMHELAHTIGIGTRRPGPPW